jgi:hypothetical protein
MTNEYCLMGSTLAVAFVARAATDQQLHLLHTRLCAAQSETNVQL